MTGESRCLVVAGPSGVGKTSVIKGALEKSSDWVFSVSATTRKIRDGEEDGREYYFWDKAGFEGHAASGGFLEYANVYGNLYGTPVKELQRAKEAGKHLLIEVDTVGCLSIRAIMPETRLVGIIPPSINELKNRLTGRGTESEDSLSFRFANIRAELQRMQGFDFVVVNDKLPEAIDSLLGIMELVESGSADCRQTIGSLLADNGGANETGR